jgi:hypothetical protein
LADDLRHLDHLFVIERAVDEDFHRGGQGNTKVRPVEYRAHGLAIRSQLSDTFSDIEQTRESVALGGEQLNALGSVIVLEGADAAYPLQIDSLNRLSTHRRSPKRPLWLLLSVQPPAGAEPERATVWISDAYRSKFLQIFEEYLTTFTTRAAPATWETVDGNPSHRALVANIARIRTAVLDDLWTSSGEPPRRGKHWWELWLETVMPHSDALENFISVRGLRKLPRSIAFPGRSVVWVEATWEDLQILPFTSIPLAEVRRPEFTDTIEDLTISDQDEYVLDLADRVIAAPLGAPAVAHLDTGVLRTHELLRDSLAETDHHTLFGTSGNDVRNHGTSMAGLALYGDLDDMLTGTGTVQLSHRLESVRLTPSSDETEHDPQDFGTATVEAIAILEIGSQRSRAFCLPLSASADKPGEPTLWSSTVDALAAGTDVVRDGEQLKLLSIPDPSSARLILVAAGNVDSYQHDHHTESDTSAVEDPAQAWNVLTVGAHTNFANTPTDPQYEGWSPMAVAGTLSPHSRTSVMFANRRWPIKPDICMEGGNVLTDGDTGFEDKHPLLSLRSTGSANDLALASANATSAATAQAARLAALEMVRYPSYWPETIRGLLVHAAEWTPAMEAEIRGETTKVGRLHLLRRYGWGVPTEDAVLRSSRQSVTLVGQDEFVPFEGDEYRMRRFRLHTLPWPAEALADLGTQTVRMRVTLSYFIEPSPSRRGWRQRYAYASHGLRFDLQGPLENQREFVQRVNRDAQSDEGGSSRSGTTSSRWMVGADQRNLGSLHQDIWEGTGYELAECNSVAVYPVGGWWKNNGRKDRLDLPIRYSLLVSLSTDEQDIDIYSPIANEMGVSVATEIAGT